MSLYKQPGSEIWWASVTVNGERVRVSTGEYARPAAQKFHDKLKAKRHDAPVLKGRTWGAAVMKWVEAQERSDSDIQALAKFGKHYPDRLLTSVTDVSVDKALRSFVKTEGTYNRYLNRICAVMNLSGAPLKIMRKRNKKPKLRTWLTHEQWGKLYAQLPVHLKASALFAVSTGLRQANVLGLRWDHVDLGRATAWVDSSDSKSGEPISVPLNTTALAALEVVKGQHPEWCFTYRGKPYSEIKTAFQAAAVRAKVGRYVDGRYDGFTWHGLRHTWATWHAQSGTPLEVLQELGGWTDMRMLMEHYAHHVKGVKAKYIDNIGMK